MFYKLFLNICALVAVTTALSSETQKILEKHKNMTDVKHGIQMGVVLKGCDDAKDDLKNDWNESPINYTCYHANKPYAILDDVQPIEECQHLSPSYMPQHFCMKDKIEYNETLPTFGDHRPLWPVFGEYIFVPPQRWLHNVEHGAIIMLYHPCADPIMVEELRKLVRNCIRKHIITPDSYRLTPERPLALVTWGCKLIMNKVDAPRVISFIEKNALNGPEGTYPKEGQYTFNLLQNATVPIGSTYNDSVLCPFSHKFNIFKSNKL